MNIGKSILTAIAITLAAPAFAQGSFYADLGYLQSRGNIRTSFPGVQYGNTSVDRFVDRALTPTNPRDGLLPIETSRSLQGAGIGAGLGMVLSDGHPVRGGLAGGLIGLGIGHIIGNRQERKSFDEHLGRPVVPCRYEYHEATNGRGQNLATYNKDCLGSGYEKVATNEIRNPGIATYNHAIYDLPEVARPVDPISLLSPEERELILNERNRIEAERAFRSLSVEEQTEIIERTRMLQKPPGNDIVPSPTDEGAFAPTPGENDPPFLSPVLE